MGVDDEVLVLAMVAGDVPVGDPRTRQSLEKAYRIITMVDAVDVDVVDIEQQGAIGFFQHRVDELQFAHFGARRRVVGDVLDADAPFQQILGAPDARGHVAHGFIRERNGHQVVEVAVVGAIAEVFGVETNAVLVEEPADPADEGLVEWRRPAE